MATGIVKREQFGRNATTAFSNKSAKYLVLSGNNKTKEVTEIHSNSYILADNIIALSKLRDTYRNKITLIYLDPPYGTGMDFQSRSLQHAYTDKMEDNLWLNFMRERLFIMRELLSDDGSIYIHIGHQMLFHLKILMDEIFGSNNFRNLITRKKCSSKNYTKNQYPNLNDYILFYTKTNTYKWNQPGTPASQEWVNKEYPKFDEKGRYKLVPIHAPGVRNGETGKPWRGMNPPLGKHWQLTPSKLDKLDESGEIHWSKNGNPRRKVYLPKNKQLPITDYWDQYRDAHHQSIKVTGYPTEKNLNMLKMIVKASSNEGDIILDPFCGSGTTVHAARDLSRHWIGIDESFTSAEATLKRMRHGMQEMGDYVNGKNKVKNLDLFEDMEKEDKYTQFSFITTDINYHKNKNEIEKLASI